MMMPDESGGYIDDVVMPDKSERGIYVMMVPGKSGGYTNVMVMLHMVSIYEYVGMCGYVIVWLSPCVHLRYEVFLEKLSKILYL